LPPPFLPWLVVGFTPQHFLVAAALVWSVAVVIAQSVKGVPSLRVGVEWAFDQVAASVADLKFAIVGRRDVEYLRQ
jgi:hypothetical protein